MNEYPVMLNLSGKKVIIVGGGRIARRKIKNLLGCGALITVISPKIHQEIQQLVLEHRIHLIEREVVAEDLRKAFLIITTTNSIAVNDFVVKHASEHQLVNASHSYKAGNVSIPAILRRGKLSIAVSTGGASPILAKKIRDDLAMRYNNSYSNYVDRLYELRLETKKLCIDEEERKRILEKAMITKFINVGNGH
ncbi:NAD(P)-binding protein [Guptibacillus hwajinpoensis]|uniref:precorrin-2 dehydrogenase n=1 Tax=Guptibacillus hwajinpoensis TaxID=208199 RepID=A0A0J6CX91_9BACL|nr:NAD(P)-binding protein [Alkalihalobacillus macyae]KMM37805.1 hypothetical protein AB986_00165 [Alkalihalobacillus macyae]